MVLHEFSKAPDDLAVMSSDAELRSTIESAYTHRANRTVHFAGDPDELMSAVIARRMHTIVIDRDCGGAANALRRLSALPMRAEMLVIVVARDPVGELPQGADIVALEGTLGAALELATGSSEEPPIDLERLLAVSLLPGGLDQALARVADQLASGFGVERCVISIRDDSSTGAASGTRTWSSLAWSYTADRCRAAVSAGASLLATMPDKPHEQCETYLAASLETQFGGDGFVGLIVSKPRVFNPALYVALAAVAKRLAVEVSWRGVYERASEEIDRMMSGPGLDPLLGIWNKTALKQLSAMLLSSALRATLPFSALVIDIVDLQSLNNRYGLEVGDRLLRRIADSVSATVRQEDLVGRWSGDAIAVVLNGVGPEGAQRVAERLRAVIEARPLELAGSESLKIPVTFGIAQYGTGDGALAVLTRAARAAQQAQLDGEIVQHAGPQPMTNPRLSGEIEIASEDIAATLGGTYRLLHEISRGGMGVVYRAQDRALERPVAIKMLRPDLAEDPELVERFRIEAAMLAHIQHPNLVQIYTFGHTGGDSYFVMELVEGESLEQAFERHRLEGTAMALVDVPPVIEQIAAALDALHERGIVHRDVKPANVILDPFRNRSVLVDVGIARRYGQDAATAGTPGFVAPEVLGDGEASPRSDVYGLAATAYTMLTLTRPWGEGELVTLLSRQCADELTRPSRLRAELAPVDDLFVRALSSKPDRRPTSAGAFARELTAALSGVRPRTIYPRRPASGRMRALAKPSQAETARTRGVVFRSVARALGMRESERLRDRISDREPELAEALANGSPLAWIPTELLVKLFAVAPQHLERENATLARDIARATVRASFRRFFPASAATLVPERTLSAIRNIWGRYQSWGAISAMPVHTNEVVVRLTDTLREQALCAWTSGLLEQLAVLSGAKHATVAHEQCEALGHAACLFRVSWERD